MNVNMLIAILIIATAIIFFIIGNVAAMHRVDKHLEDLSGMLYNLARKYRELERQITDYLGKY